MNAQREDIVLVLTQFWIFSVSFFAVRLCVSRFLLRRLTGADHVRFYSPSVSIVSYTTRPALILYQCRSFMFPYTGYWVVNVHHMADWGHSQSLRDPAPHQGQPLRCRSRRSLPILLPVARSLTSEMTVTYHSHLSCITDP
jgi:hypothetical protein